MTEGKKNDKNHYNGKRNGGGRLRKVESFSGDFSEGRNAGRSGDGDEIRKTKHNHAATNRKNRKRTGEKMIKYWTTDGTYYTESESFIKTHLLKNYLQAGKEFYTIRDGNGEIIALAIVKE